MNRRVLLPILIVVVAVTFLAGPRALRLVGCLPKTQIALRKVYQGPPTTMGSPVEDWPRGRGPRGDQISREVLSDEWPAGGPRTLWAADVGLGYSSPVVAGGRLYLFSMNGERDTLTAFDADSGKIAWSVEGDSGWSSAYPGTRATPTVDGDRIYTYGGGGELTCRNVADGKARWTLNVLKETGGTTNQWGIASSPLVTADRVYVQGGQGGAIVVAVDKMSGSVAWKSQATGSGGYAHPILIDVAGSPQLIVFAGDALVAMNPADGRTTWREPWQTSYDVNACTPIYRDGRLFVTSEYQRGCAQFQVTPTGAKKLWENNNIEGKFQGAILDGDHLYANSTGALVCVKWEDGSLAWSAAKDPKLRLGAGGSLIRAGDKLLAMSERGKLSLIRATREGYELIGQGDGVDGKEVWATPVLYGGRLYAKGAQELVCLDLAPKK
jgi:outer membrane protein assembly factor BamB